MTVNSSAQENTNCKPLVSVIIPTFNRGHLIQRAIKSVLEQTYTNLELIIVDDCSNDNTELKVQEFNDERIIYLKNDSNLGPSASRNKAIYIAKGDYIAFLDSDDFYYTTKIEKQVNLIKKSDYNIGAVYCGMEYFDFKSGQKTGHSLFEVDFKKNFTHGTFLLAPANVTLFLKKNVLVEVGGFNEELRAHEDTELAIRISRKYGFTLVRECLVGVTRNHDQLMGNNFNYIKALEIIYKKHIDFLSKKILFILCKQIANYHILTNEIIKAKLYVILALKYKPSDFKMALQFLKTVMQFALLYIFPSILKSIYYRKYQGQIPLTSGLIKK